ncbi:hypothetical protein M422DRAFT_159267 [Sphaerobolus stellatus SS14]|nr:hypothetical protein M422DRAFT_159267 [Sphaerobolus stellatus SS14]
MLVLTLITLLLGVKICSALPLIRRATTLDQAAVAEAQVRDNTATRAFSAVPLKVFDGSCLFVDPLSGDFRENLIPIQTAKCDGSAGQQWDIITRGVHNDQPGFALIVSTLTNGCLNFDPRRAAGNQVLLFSCGGRADGGGQVTDSQLFAFSGGAGPLPLLPQNGKNMTCLTITNSKLDQTNCSPATASGNELFTFGNGAAAVEGASNASKTTSAVASSSTKALGKANDRGKKSKGQLKTLAALASASASSAAGVTTLPTKNSAVKAGVKLDQAAVAEAQQRDNTANRALSAAPIKAPNGQCLFVDPTSGDFRENLIPIQTASCDGSAAQQWDVITEGKHNNVPGTALIVSSLTQGCLNFDPRRAAGNQVLLFSCGGRADGQGQVTNSQQFVFNGATKGIPLVPVNSENATCLEIAANGLLDQSSCNAAKPSANQLFTLG